MSYEIPRSKVITWQGIELNAKHANQQLAILTVSNTEEDSYDSAVNTITALNLRATNTLAKLPLEQFDSKRPSFACAIIPRANFLEATKMPANYSWAKICSRSLWRKGREDLVVVSSQYADFIDFDAKTPLEHLQEGQVDVLREVIHEHLPTLRDYYLPYPSAESLPISEAMDELVPRYILGLQQYMPASTAFLRNIAQTDLLTVNELWSDFSRHDSRPVSQNRAYGSAFLLGLGLIRQIEQEHQVGSKAALSKWMDAIVEAETPEAAVNKLASLARVDENEVWQGISLQLRGKDLLTSFENKK